MSLRPELPEYCRASALYRKLQTGAPTSKNKDAKRKVKQKAKLARVIMSFQVIPYTPEHIETCLAIWNEVVRDGIASEAEWEQFCDEYVTAEFPDGYTTIRATGYWKSEESSATMREDSRIIVILASSDAKEKVRRIARQYRSLFQQEAVLIVTSPADAEFVEASSEEQP